LSSLKEKLRLLVITDKKLKPNIVKAIEDVLRGGATSIQLRLKESSTKEMIEVGRKIRKLTRNYGALYFVDDRLDVALATDADGVQLGPDDMPIAIAREMAPNLIIGGSVYSLEEALSIPVFRGLTLLGNCIRSYSRPKMLCSFQSPFSGDLLC
jgi:thiamine-phosphate pyrophosphorylase